MIQVVTLSSRRIVPKDEQSSQCTYPKPHGDVAHDTIILGTVSTLSRLISYNVTYDLLWCTQDPGYISM
jgi:hypothetical protein